MKSKPQNPPQNDLPTGLAQPALRALAAAGCHNLAQVAALSEAELKQLHGIGPNALEQLRQALAEKGLTFAKKESHAQYRAL